VSDTDAPPIDPRSLIRSKQYRSLLVFAALVGVLVSLAAWCFLEAVHYMQVGIFDDLPDGLGYDTPPWWWPLPWLALAGGLTTFAIERLPGRGGHVPADGLQSTGSQTRPVDLPGILLAAFASLGLGIVLGPEAPLIALGMGLAILAIRLVKKDASDQILAVLAAAGSFAAIASLFGSPVVGAVIIIEAAGLGGPILPVILLPGLLAAAIGSLVFTGIGDWTGLSTSAYALRPLPLPEFSTPGVGDFVWTIALAVAAAAVVFAIVQIARGAGRIVGARPIPFTIAAALAIGILAIAFDQTTDESSYLVLFSGQEAFGPLLATPTLPSSTLVALLVFKGLAWSASMGSFRGGPTFPALFLGAVAGLLAAQLPGLSETPAVAVLMAAACVSVLRLPLSSVIIALALTSGTGLGVSPLIVVAVVVAYVTTVSLSAFWGAEASAHPSADANTPAAEEPSDPPAAPMEAPA
jgi:chloride channel protein, CIC family